MNHISKIIFDVLASGRGINLPDVGALYVERESAKFVNKHEIRPPSNKVVFSRNQNEQFESVIDLMVSGGQQRAEAEQQYAEWVEVAGSNNGLFEINEVGVVKQNFFYPSAALHDTLNPGDQKTVRLKSSGSGRKWLIILLIILAVVAIAIAAYFLFIKESDNKPGPVTDPVEQGAVTPPAGTEAGETIEGTTPEVAPGDDPQPEGYVPGEEAGTAVEPSAETEAGGWVEREKPATLPNVVVEELNWWQKFLNIFRCGDNKRKPKVISTPEPTPELERIEVPTGDTEEGNGVSDGGEKGAVAPAGTVYHVVVGVFSDPANADKVIRGDHLYIGGAAYKKYPYKGGKTMVSAFSSTDKAEAERMLRKLRVYDSELWLYTQK